MLVVRGVEVAWLRVSRALLLRFFLDSLPVGELSEGVVIHSLFQLASQRRIEVRQVSSELLRLGRDTLLFGRYLFGTSWGC